MEITQFLHIVFAIFMMCAFCKAFDVKKDLYFELYTREEPFRYQIAIDEPMFSAMTFNPNRPTKLFVHGYRSKAKVINRYVEAYLRAGDYNFIAVNWTKGAGTLNYYLAKSRVKDVARELARLIDGLAELHGMRLQELVVIGHSLGAHIAGRAAKQLKTPEKIACIIGLDPASVFYNFFETEKRLASSDADYVQVIHTDRNKFGIGPPIGHADFYPNGGAQQPGCPLGKKLTNLIEKCNHGRSHAFFLESLFTDFLAIQCTTYEEIEQNKCTHTGIIGKMGGDIDPHSPKPMGIFYLETNLSPPYVILDVAAFHNYELVTYEGK